MESSRIFVRGLPPTFTEDEFKKHFSIQPVTDVKLMSQRRIGYVGYKTPEEAAKAVKYFNKSFIRMSRIAVELARPVAEAPKSRRQIKSEGKGGYATVASEQPTNDHFNDNTRKRKRDVASDKPEDPKLKEFLETMKVPLRSQTWANGGNEPDASIQPDVAEPMHVEDVEAASDDEYQVVSKKAKKISLESKTTNDKATIVESTSNDNSLDQSLPVKSHQEGDEGLNMIPPQAQDNTVSDADWLRSRTNRRLELDDDDNVDERAETARTMGQPEENGESQEESERVIAAPISDDSAPLGNVQEVQPIEQEDTSVLESIRNTGRLFLRNLSYTISEGDIREKFAAFGPVEEIHIPLDFKSGAGKGFAYVQFASPDDAVEAFQSLDATIFLGRLLHIIPASAKRDNKLDEFALSKLPLKKQKQIQRKAEAASTTFNWNSLYMNADAVMSSISDRLGVSKSELLDPTSSDAAVKQAQAETHLIQETKAFFTENGVDLEAFKKRERGDTAILIKNFPYGTTKDELKIILDEHGTVTTLLMPPSGTIAIAEYALAPQARAAFGALAYRKIKNSVLFLEKAPKDVFGGTKVSAGVSGIANTTNLAEAKLSTTELLQPEPTLEAVDTSTLFVRNLNFSTSTERLIEVFSPLDGFLSAKVKTKTDAKKPGQILSMGFGFLEFRDKNQAQAALSAMQGYNLDGHQLLIKASHKALDAAEERRKEDRAKKAAGRRTKLLIKNLPFEASKKDLRALFGAYGQLRSVRMPKKHDNSTRGFAFADFTTPREAENALNALRNTHLLGRRLVLDFAAEDPEDAEAEIEKMQKKVGSQVNKVALERLTSGGRKKFRVGGNDDLDDA